MKVLVVMGLAFANVLTFGTLSPKARAATEGRPYSSFGQIKIPSRYLLVRLRTKLGTNCRGGPPWPPVSAKNERATNEQTQGRLELSLASQKSKYKRNDQFKLHVMLRNSSQRDVYIFGTLDWGYSSSLMFYIRDASGREIQPQLFPDAQTYASADDTSAFVKLGPDHFLGTTYYAPLRLMNLARPGRYAIFVKYSSPFSASEVKLSPFWGKENGALKSNVVWIEVVR